jgi:uncharacterized membrane protein
LVLTVVAVGSVVVWLLGSWVIAWVPLAGPLIAAALFSQVILVAVFVAVGWLLGMVYALQARMQPLPIVGTWAERLSF